MSEGRGRTPKAEGHEGSTEKIRSPRAHRGQSLGRGRPSQGALPVSRLSCPHEIAACPCGAASKRWIPSVPATTRGIASLVCLTLCMAASGPQSAHPYYQHPSPYMAPGGYGMATQVRVPPAYAPREGMGKIMPGSLAHLAMGLEEVRRSSQHESAAERGYVAGRASQECQSLPSTPLNGPARVPSPRKNAESWNAPVCCPHVKRLGCMQGALEVLLS